MHLRDEQTDVPCEDSNGHMVLPEHDEREDCRGEVYGKLVEATIPEIRGGCSGQLSEMRRIR
jgi:hypothetical protein